MFRIYVERQSGFENEAQRILSEAKSFLGISGVETVRCLNRYDIENVETVVAKNAVRRIFSEPQSDRVIFDSLKLKEGETQIIWEPLPGQYDQRADSAEQCLQLLQKTLGENSSLKNRGQKKSAHGETPRVRTAKVVILTGTISARDIKKIQDYLVNPVDSRLTDDAVPETLKIETGEPSKIPVVQGFTKFKKSELDAYSKKMGLAMDGADIKFLQDYFVGEGRDPSETEIRVLDTYWSDHCRHTTFLTELKEIKIEKGPYEKLFRNSLKNYQAMRTELYQEQKDRPVTLMDMAVIGMKFLRKHGKLSDLEVSDENNACSIFIDVKYTHDKHGKKISDKNSAANTECWLLMFKNETHNHPTEIEPFGGAATCIGGAIRDPLSGRAWVYQAMRVTGAADPTVSLSKTLKGKLPQLKIVRESAQGFSSYGNQIGLTTGQVQEFYHPGYAAKRMELGAVIAAAPAKNVVRGTPQAGDIVILLGGGTGRDGIGGATGSSKVHTQASVTTAAAEVQKGNAVEERKIQRLFRNEKVGQMIVRCNDFGAGGVSVAIGELAPGLEIDLDKVPKKYEGLNGTELAISESQERMAVVVRPSDVKKFIEAAAAENLNAVVVATVTSTNRLVMKWRGDVIVNLSRDFLDSAGARHEAKALIESPASPAESPLVNPLDSTKKKLGAGTTVASKKAAWLSNISDLACCSQRGLGERFDGSIGSASVLFPYGGKFQCTPEAGMVAKIPVELPCQTDTASFMAHGFDPRVSQWSAWHGAQVSVLSSLAKILCLGANPLNARLSFQEFFGRAVDAKTWGYPAAALLGSIDAQVAMGTASIGGKDSMSGTFEQINVPHTLVSFSVAHDSVQNVTSGSFKKSGSKIYLVAVPYSEVLAPDFGAFKINSQILYKLNSAKKISAMYPICAGGIAEAVTKMAMGNRIGARLDFLPPNVTAKNLGKTKGEENSFENLFAPFYGSLLVETDEDFSKENFVAETVFLLGETIREEEIVVQGNAKNQILRVKISDAEEAWESRLEKVFPKTSAAEVQNELPDFAKSIHTSLSEARKNPVFNICKKHPRVLIPVFPGTNCEYDMARAFALAGGDAKMLVFRNNTPKALSESLEELVKQIKHTQILALSGGFSAGDEPDGSGKYIANVLREGRVAEQIMNLLKNRDGLILGICNGFQALVKTGLVPYGEIREAEADMPTLTFNTIGRHISRVCRTRIVSATSPWAKNASVVDPRIHLVPISHGEGRVIIRERLAKELFAKGQIFSQYVDAQGIPAISEPDNPNGSLYAIEGMTSPDGRVLGKMGHSERTIGCEMNGADVDLLKNVVGNPLTNESENSCQNIFAAGVSYFK
uniref:Phosphoribosylformylglycinamidine synthase n=1 Tax=uncultured Spirochaetaceae bacterium TaxID=201186 RepID=A0A650EPK9_9SPIO|nr:phosphoribosylformylglycinamidine synthase [uncultured Spirochaetaceae bacterium]